MEPYAPIRGAGPFAASMDLFTALVAELQAQEAAGRTASELEELLQERGREVRGSCCKITWTYGRRGRNKAPGSTALLWQGRTGSRGAG
jgi:hypothetical protein